MSTPDSDAFGSRFPHRDLLGIAGLSPQEIVFLLDLAEGYVEVNRRPTRSGALARAHGHQPLLRELDAHPHLLRAGGKRLGADVINMSVAWSSIKKGETLIDTAMTLNAMHPTCWWCAIRTPARSSCCREKVNCAVINAGDGSHEHPTQALLDALTIRRRRGRLAGLTVAICGDIRTAGWRAPTSTC